MTKPTTIALSANAVISAIDERLYGSFIEHMGRAVYTGIYEPSHPTANEAGFRQDVIDLILPLAPSVIRYPGGNFVSGYRWEDGVGPKAERPVRLDLAWQALEPNQVGTNEFMGFLESIDSKPMYAVNLGTGSAQDAANLLEYCNFPGGTHYSDLRIAHGYPNPHNIKLWCLGNEMDGPWQICAKTAEEYGRIAHETAKMMRLIDSEIELVACGSSFRAMPTFGEWERTVLRHTYEDIDYLSLHTYYQNNEGDIPAFLANNIRMNHFIKEVRDICEEIKKEKGSEKEVKLAFDEWNVWYHFQKDGKEPPKWIEARPVEEEDYDFADALLVGSMLITLINNADFVKIACLAQLVNALAPIMTQPGGKAWAQTTYYPFLYTSQRGRGTALQADVNAASYTCADGVEIPFVDCAAVLSEDGGELTLFLVNKNLEADIPCELALDGLACAEVLEWVTMCGFPFDAVNTPEHAPIAPSMHDGSVALDKDALRFILPKASWNMIRLNLV